MLSLAGSSSSHRLVTNHRLLFLPLGRVVPAESGSLHRFFCHLPEFLGAVISYYAFCPTSYWLSTQKLQCFSLPAAKLLPLAELLPLFSAFVNHFSLGQVDKYPGEKADCSFPLIAHLPLIPYVIFWESKIERKTETDPAKDHILIMSWLHIMIFFYCACVCVCGVGGRDQKFVWFLQWCIFSHWSSFMPMLGWPCEPTTIRLHF